jgi:hypothetical protein
MVRDLGRQVREIFSQKKILIPKSHRDINQPLPSRKVPREHKRANQLPGKLSQVRKKTNWIPDKLSRVRKMAN